MEGRRKDIARVIAVSTGTIGMGMGLTNYLNNHTDISLLIDSRYVIWIVPLIMAATISMFVDIQMGQTLFGPKLRGLSKAEIWYQLMRYLFVGTNTGGKKFPSNKKASYLKSIKFFIPKNYREEALLDIEEHLDYLRDKRSPKWWITISISLQIGMVLYHILRSKLHEFYGAKEKSSEVADK